MEIVSRLNLKLIISILVMLVLLLGLAVALNLIKLPQFFNPKASGIGGISLTDISGGSLPVENGAFVSTTNTVQVHLDAPDTPVVPSGEPNITHPSLNPNPVIRWGNTSYHDSEGVREPWIVKDPNTNQYILYYDCMESFYNSSFESNWGVNGWKTYHASMAPDRNGGSAEEQEFGLGDYSLRVTTDGTPDAGAYTYEYYWPNGQIAAPAGIEVTPNTDYIASAYMWADSSTTMDIIVQQYSTNPGDFNNVLYSPSNRVLSRQSIQGQNHWARVAVKFRTLPNATAVTISFASPQGRVTNSNWDGVQLEKAAPGQNDPTPLPHFSFNQEMKDSLGWRSCYSIGSDGVNFNKMGLLAIQGAVGDWENVNRPGWVGSNWMQTSVFPYNGKWYAYYWKGGGPLNTYGSDQYGILRNQFPGSSGLDENGRADNTNIYYRDRSGLAEADSPIGPFRRISQSAPPINLPDMSVCKKFERSCSDSQGASWGCEYLTANGVPHLIGNVWVEYLAGQTSRIPGTWEGTNGGGGANACHAITSGYATAPSPLGPWTLWGGNPLFSIDDLNKITMEGPTYYYDAQSGNHLLFYNQLGGHGWGITAIWTRDPMAKWNVDNRREIVNQTTIPWGDRSNTGREVNLPSMTEDGSGHLLLYYGAREGVNAASENTETDARGYMFHDIGLATFDLPLFNPPAYQLTGYKIAESQDALQATGIQPYQSVFNFNLSAAQGTKNIFVEFEYSNGINTQSIVRQTSVIYRVPAEPSPSPSIAPESPSPTPEIQSPSPSPELPSPTPVEVSPSPSPEISSPLPVASPSPSSVPRKPGDVNNDGEVDAVDLGMIIQSYYGNPPRFAEADLDGDGSVDAIDLNLVIQNYYK